LKKPYQEIEADNAAKLKAMGKNPEKPWAQ